MRRVMDPTEHLAPICNRRKAAQIRSTSGRMFSGAVSRGRSQRLFFVRFSHGPLASLWRRSVSLVRAARNSLRACSASSSWVASPRVSRSDFRF